MEEQKQAGTSYGIIFETTFLFGFVQVFKAVISIVKYKLAAILIGAEGMGILGIYNTVIQLVQTGAGLGVNQSAVRDISEAKGAEDHNRFSTIISVVNKVILYTGLLGCFITLCLSYWISDWTFGDHAHIIAYFIIAFVIGLNIINETKQAILKGMRQLRSLAKASMIGSVISLITTLPLYYFFGKDGIVPELLIASTLAVLVSDYYVSKIEYTKVQLSLKETWRLTSPMIQMGTALMAVTFLQTIVAFIVNAYIRSKGGLADVGFYSAGTTITNAYFGVIITALMTDYYPRIAAVNKDNNALQDELNKQSLVSLVLCCPLFVLFMTLLPLFITILYTDEFLPVADFVKWSIYFTLITLVSNQVDMILVAKFQTRVMLILSVIVRVIQLLLSIALYSLWGLEGLGITYLILGVLHMVLMCSVVYYRYRIRFSSLFLKIAIIVLVLAVSASFIQSKFVGIRYYALSCVLLVLATIFSLYVSNTKLGVNFYEILKTKIKK